MDLPLRYLKSLGLFLLILIPGTVAIVVTCAVLGHPPFHMPPGPGWEDAVITWDEFSFLSTWSAHLLTDGMKFGTSLFLMGQCMSIWGFSNRVRTACLAVCGGVSLMLISGISGLGLGLANRVTFSLTLLGVAYGALALPRWTRAKTAPPPRDLVKLVAGIMLWILPIWFFTWMTYQPYVQSLDLSLYKDRSPAVTCLDTGLPDSAEMAWLNSHGKDGTRLCAVFRSRSRPFGTTNQADMRIILGAADTGEARFAIPRRARALYLETDSGSRSYPKGFPRLKRHVRIKRLGGDIGKWLIRIEPDTAWVKITGPGPAN